MNMDMWMWIRFCVECVRACAQCTCVEFRELELMKVNGMVMYTESCEDVLVCVCVFYSVFVQ